MEFFVQGEIKFNVDLDITADTEEQAKAKAIELIADYYHLNVTGAHHDKKLVEYNIEANEYSKS